jgi:hypothetical protein
MQDVIDTYFHMIEKEERRPTVCGLALALNMTRQTLIMYAKEDEFSDTIKNAKLRIEMALEEGLWDGAPAGKIFNLKNNFGWKDESTQKVTGPGGGPVTIQIIGVPGAGE